MPKKLSVIYIPGLGESNYSYQRKAINFWRHYGIKAYLYKSNWSDKKSWQHKKAELCELIDKQSMDNQLYLIGVSAGASAAINLYSLKKDKIKAIILIAGKVNNPTNIHLFHLKKNPAFVQSVNECRGSLNNLNESYRKRILSIYSYLDFTVRPKDSYIYQAKNVRLLWPTHVLTIASQLTLGFGKILSFIKKHN